MLFPCRYVGDAITWLLTNERFDRHHRRLVSTIDALLTPARVFLTIERFTKCQKAKMPKTYLEGIILPLGTYNQ
jgi:hypothetical protein